MTFSRIIVVSFLLAGCIPQVQQIPSTPTAAAPILIATPLTPPTSITEIPLSTVISQPEDDPVLVGSGDIAHCRSDGDEITAAMLDNILGTIFTTGDNVYPDGTPEQFANCYDPTWGRHKDRTYPSPGNHDYHYQNGAGYFEYFGMRAGEPGKGYYSYDLETWHIIALNSNISLDVGSEQDEWLRAELAAHPVTCTLAYWHHPRFSSGAVHGSIERVEPLWQALYEYGADVVLGGHEHTYERFAPQDPQGNPDPARGIRQFVIGSGGRSHYAFGPPIANSEVRNSDTNGLLKLTLHDGTYSWEFIPEPGKSFTDSGTAPCVTP